MVRLSASLSYSRSAFLVGQLRSWVEGPALCCPVSKVPQSG